MPSYQFQTEDFALSSDGVHLLRNQFNFKTIGYNDIRQARIERSVEIRNAPAIFCIGILLVAFAFYQTRWVVWLFNDPRTFHIDIISIVLPIIPLLLGSYCLYASIRKGPVLRLEEGSRVHKLRLRPVVKKNLTAELERYMGAQLGPAFQVDRSALE
jgi:hypothetical protein